MRDNGQLKRRALLGGITSINVMPSRMSRRFTVTFEVFDSIHSKNLVLRFGGTTSSGDWIYEDTDALPVTIIAKYTEDCKVTCLDFDFSTTPPCPSHHQGNGDEPQSPITEYLPEEDELIIYVTADKRRSGAMIRTFDDDIEVDAQDQLLVVVIKNASTRVPSG